MRSYNKTSHSVHDLKVHLIWITKYRYKVLIKEIGYRIRDIIRQVCDANQITIIKGLAVLFWGSSLRLKNSNIVQAYPYPLRYSPASLHTKISNIPLR
ncbi:MAG: transposase [Desulfamplus sp.]